MTQTPSDAFGTPRATTSAGGPRTQPAAINAATFPLQDRSGAYSTRPLLSRETRMMLNAAVAGS